MTGSDKVSEPRENEPNSRRKSKMRKTVAIIALATVLGGCTTSTSYGECKGLANQAEKSPKLRYNVSVKNIFLAAIFSENLIWPILTGAFWVWCPEGPAQ